jgi:hypothetical protein
MRWVGHMPRVGEERKVYKVSVGKPQEKRLLGRPRRRWENGIRMDLRELGWDGVGWFQLAEGRSRWRAIVNAVMNLRVLTSRSYRTGGQVLHPHKRPVKYFCIF